MPRSCSAGIGATKVLATREDEKEEKDSDGETDRGRGTSICEVWVWWAGVAWRKGVAVWGGEGTKGVAEEREELDLR